MTRPFNGQLLTPALKLPELVRAPGGSWWIEAQQQPRDEFAKVAAVQQLHMRKLGLHADREGKS
jgi:hypothetical protein